MIIIGYVAFNPNVFLGKQKKISDSFIIQGVQKGIRQNKMSGCTHHDEQYLLWNQRS